MACLRPGIREKWRCRTVTEHLPSERCAQGIFFLHHRTKNRHDRCPAPLNAYIQEEIHHGSDSIQNSKNFSLCVCPTGGTRDTGIWYSSALRNESSFIYLFFFPDGVIECCSHITSHFLLSIRMQPAMGCSGELNMGMVSINIVIQQHGK